LLHTLPQEFKHGYANRSKYDVKEKPKEACDDAIFADFLHLIASTSKNPECDKTKHRNEE